MPISQATKADFDQIVTEIADFWGSDRTLHLHHAGLIYEFGDTAFVIREGDQVAAYLFGYLAQTGPDRLRPSGRGTGRIPGPGTRTSTLRPLHGRGAGARLHGPQGDHHAHQPRLDRLPYPVGDDPCAASPNADGVPVVRDYAGPGLDRVVFHLPL